MSGIDFYLRKTTVIVYVGLINFLISNVVAQAILHTVASKYTPSRPLAANLASLSATLSSVILGGYVVRLVLRRIVASQRPLAREGVFDPTRVSEVRGTLATAFSFFMHLGPVVNSFHPVLKLPALPRPSLDDLPGLSSKEEAAPDDES